MPTLVYSPGIKVVIATSRKGMIDISDDIESGSLSLRENAPHSFSVAISNPRRKYDGLFLPNDRITVSMKRIRWVQVFSGYLSKVPFMSVWPRTVRLEATCTLKKLQYTQYDRGAAASVELFNSVSQDIPAGTDESDGSLSQRAVLALTKICDWPEDKIHIAALPDQWWQSVSALYETISPSLEPSAEALAFVSNGATIGGTEQSSIPDGVTVGGTNMNPSIMGPSSVTVDDIVNWWGSKPQPQVASVRQLATWFIAYGNSEGVRGDLAFVQSCFETGWYTNGPSKNDNNFSGIAHYDGQSRGASFATPQDGVLAQIQLLKKVVMGNNVQLANPDKSLNWAGTNTNQLSGLSGNWASAKNYGAVLGGMFSGLLGSKPLATASSPSSGGGLGSSLGGSFTSTTPVTSPTSGASPGYRSDFGPTSTQYVHPLPSGRDNKNFGEQRKTHVHQGTDISAPQGTPMVAVVDGTITLKPANGAAGNTIWLTAANGDVFKYFHIMDGGYLVTQGATVKAGQAIAKVGSTGRSTGPHLHFEYHPGGGSASSPEPILNGAKVGEVTSADGVGLNAGSLLNADQYFPTIDAVSGILTGPRALMNDSPVFATIQDFIQSSMRSFCSAPNGDFIAWFPDYFGRYNQIGKMVIEPIELVDFTIDWDDRYMVTHQFVTGSVNGWNGNVSGLETLRTMVTTMGVASIDFPEILEAVVGTTEGDWLDPASILARFGARPDSQKMSAVTSHEAEFFFAIYLFARAWAQQFSANTPISFMPELWPGMLLKIPSQGLQVYLEGVTHTFDLRDGGGFETSIQVTAPSSLDGRFVGLPKAGALSPVVTGNSSPPVYSSAVESNVNIRQFDGKYGEFGK